jgi:hypothetical protein
LALVDQVKVKFEKSNRKLSISNEEVFQITSACFGGNIDPNSVNEFPVNPRRLRVTRTTVAVDYSLHLETPPKTPFPHVLVFGSDADDVQEMSLANS